MQVFPLGNSLFWFETVVQGGAGGPLHAPAGPPGPSGPPTIGWPMDANFTLAYAPNNVFG